MITRLFLKNFIIFWVNGNNMKLLTVQMKIQDFSIIFPVAKLKLKISLFDLTLNYFLSFLSSFFYETSFSLVWIPSKTVGFLFHWTSKYNSPEVKNKRLFLEHPMFPLWYIIFFFFVCALSYIHVILSIFHL